MRLLCSLSILWAARARLAGATESGCPGCQQCVAATTCHGRGACSDTGTCACNEGWGGRDCSSCDANWYPAGVCNRVCDQSTCTPPSTCLPSGDCRCAAGFYGSTCTLRCPRCNVEGTARCDDGRLGSGSCVCKPGFGGILCKEPVTWQTSDWGPCEGRCGGAEGAKYRHVWCKNLVTATITEDSGCLGAPPAAEMACKTATCTCSTPPQIEGGDFEEQLRVCSWLAHDDVCEAKCKGELIAFGTFRCHGMHYTEVPRCIPLGVTMTAVVALYLYTTLTGVPAAAAQNLTRYAELTGGFLLGALLRLSPGLEADDIVLHPFEEVQRRRLTAGTSAGISLELPFTIAPHGSEVLSSAHAKMQGLSSDAKTLLALLREDMARECERYPPSINPFPCMPPEGLNVSTPVLTQYYRRPFTSSSAAGNIVQNSMPGDGNQAKADIDVVGFMVLGVAIAVCIGATCAGMAFLCWRRSQRTSGKVADAGLSPAESESKPETSQVLEDAKSSLREAALLPSEEKLEVLAVTSEPDGAFVGDLLDDLPHGEGRQEWPGGKLYAGQWFRGDPCGHGVMRSGGWIYCGQFLGGHRHGIGRCEWPSEQLWYDGDWHGDMQHGLGEWGCLQPGQGGPMVWHMHQGNRVDSVARSSVDVGPDEPLLCVVLRNPLHSGGPPSCSSRLEVEVKAWGFSVGDPDAWLPQMWGALLLTRLRPGCPLALWNEAQVAQHGESAPQILANATIWAVNNVRGDTAKMVRELVAAKQTKVRLEVRNPPQTRFEHLRANVARRGPGQGYWRFQASPHAPFAPEGAVLQSSRDVGSNEAPLNSSRSLRPPSSVAEAPSSPSSPGATRLVAQLRTSADRPGSRPLTT